MRLLYPLFWPLDTPKTNGARAPQRAPDLGAAVN